jgi:hypothetical protein
MMKALGCLILPFLIQAEVPSVSFEGISVQLNMAKVDALDVLQKRFIGRKMQSGGDMWCLKNLKDKSEDVCSTPGGILIFHGGRLNYVSKHYGDDPEALVALIAMFQVEAKFRSTVPFEIADSGTGRDNLSLKGVSFTFGGKRYSIEVTLKNNLATSFLITETLSPSTTDPAK